MKWLPILLAIMGFNAMQAFQVATIMEMIWVKGALFIGKAL